MSQDLQQELYKAARTGSLDSVKSILDSIPANDFNEFINSSDRDGCSGLFHAVSNGHFEIAKYLISRGSKVDIQNDEEKPLIFESIASGAPSEFIELLISHKTPLDSQFEEKDLVSECVEWDNVELLKFFIAKGLDVNHQAKKRNTPLHEAAKKNNAEMVEILLKAGAVPIAQNKKKKTPLALLLDQDSHQIKDVLQLLVKAGANINEVDDDGNTFLHRICEYEGTMLTTVKVRSLLEMGADANVRNALDQTPLDLLEDEFSASEDVINAIRDLLLNGPVKEDEKHFRVFVKTISNTMYPIILPLGAQTTVFQLKEAIFQKEDVPPNENNLKFGKVLLEDDNAKLADYKIRHEDDILSILVTTRF